MSFDGLVLMYISLRFNFRFYILRYEIFKLMKTIISIYNRFDGILCSNFL